LNGSRRAGSSDEASSSPENRRVRQTSPAAPSRLFACRRCVTARRARLTPPSGSRRVTKKAEPELSAPDGNWLGVRAATRGQCEPRDFPPRLPRRYAQTLAPTTAGVPTTAAACCLKDAGHAGSAERPRRRSAATSSPRREASVLREVDRARRPWPRDRWRESQNAARTRPAREPPRRSPMTPGGQGRPGPGGRQRRRRPRPGGRVRQPGGAPLRKGRSSCANTGHIDGRPSREFPRRHRNDHKNCWRARRWAELLLKIRREAEPSTFPRAPSQSNPTVCAWPGTGGWPRLSACAAAFRPRPVDAYGALHQAAARPIRHSDTTGSRAR